MILGIWPVGCIFCVLVKATVFGHIMLTKIFGIIQARTKFQIVFF